MYGERSQLRFLIGAVLVIVLLFVVILLLINGGSKKSPVTQQSLTSYINNPDITVTETIVGPVTADQTHNQLQISVSNQTTVAQISQGYEGNVTASKSYPMTTNGFSEFLYALDHAGFTKGNADSTLKNDQGYCPTGQRYIFTISNAAQTVQRFWATNCGNTKRTYGGNLNLTLSLFQAQVPDYNDMTNNVDLGAGLSL